MLYGIINARLRNYLSVYWILINYTLFTGGIRVVMGKKIVVSFPGGRGSEIPILYFGAKHYEDQGYDKLFIRHPGYGAYSFEDLLSNAEKIIRQIDFNQYDEIVFVAKSIGTVVACEIKEKLSLPVTLILFTPINETLPYIIHSKNDVKLIAIGNKDRYIDVEMLQKVCKQEGIPCHIEQGVGHRMEVLHDLGKNLEIISNVISKLN